MSLRPHGRALIRPAVVLVGVAGLAGFSAAAVPKSEYRTALLVGIGVLLLLLVKAGVLPFLHWLSTTFTVTDRRVSARRGVLRRRTRDVWLWRIADVVVERTVVQRMIGSGTLQLDTTGERGSVVLRDVPGVLAVAARLNDLLDGPEDTDGSPERDEYVSRKKC